LRGGKRTQSKLSGNEKKYRAGGKKALETIAKSEFKKKEGRFVREGNGKMD